MLMPARGIRREGTMRYSRNTDFGSALSPDEVGGGAVYNRLDVRSPMNMKLWLITGMVALIALVSFADGATKKRVTKKTTDSEKKDKNSDKKERDFKKLQDIGLAIELPEKAESLTDDMEKLDQQVTLTEQQKKKIPEMRTARDKALESWDKVNRKKFDDMRVRLEKLSAGKGTRACKSIVGLMSAMCRTRASMAASHERKLFAVLTAEQRAKWNAPILLEILREEFSSLELSKGQTAKIESSSNAEAKRCRFPLGANVSTQITGPIKKYVYTRILTAKQRKEYAAMKKGGEKAEKKGGAKAGDKGR